MAGSVNKVILVGNLGRDPEVRSTQDGLKIVTLSLATSETWRDRNSGERQVSEVASEDLPEPDSPVITTRRSRGRSRSIFFKLCSRAPRTEITGSDIEIRAP